MNLVHSLLTNKTEKHRYIKKSLLTNNNIYYYYNNKKEKRTK